MSFGYTPADIDSFAHGVIPLAQDLFAGSEMRSRNLILAVVMAVAALSLVQCYQRPATFDATLYPGTWAGTWADATGQPAGAVAITVTLNSATSTLAFYLDVGGADLVDSVSMDGTYTETQLTVSASTAELGVVSATLTGDGSLSGTAYPPSFDSLTFSGSWDDTLLDMSYEISQSTNVYTGTALLTKQP